jgi:hypothetical protein
MVARPKYLFTFYLREEVHCLRKRQHLRAEHIGKTSESVTRRACIESSTKVRQHIWQART